MKRYLASGVGIAIRNFTLAKIRKPKRVNTEVPNSKEQKPRLVKVAKND